MSTRSLIGKLHENGQVEYIYCHWDGYLDNNGKILFNNYRDDEAITELLAGGGMSSLADTPSDCNTYAKQGEAMEDNNACFISYDKYIGEADIAWSEYRYIWKDGRWFVFYTVYLDYENVLWLVEQKDVQVLTKINKYGSVNIIAPLVTAIYASEMND